MTIAELGIALALMVILSTSTLTFMQTAWASLGAAAQTITYCRVQPSLQTTFTKTVGEAARVNIYSSSAVALQASVSGVNPQRTGNSGSALRLDYTAGPNSNGGGAWYAAIYLSGTNLIYCNQDNKSWTIASNVTSIAFDVTNGGILVSTIVANGLNFTLWTAIN